MGLTHCENRLVEQVCGLHHIGNSAVFKRHENIAEELLSLILKLHFVITYSVVVGKAAAPCRRHADIIILDIKGILAVIKQSHTGTVLIFHSYPLVRRLLYAVRRLSDKSVRHGIDRLGVFDIDRERHFQNLELLRKIQLAANPNIL